MKSEEPMNSSRKKKNLDNEDKPNTLYPDAIDKNKNDTEENEKEIIVTIFEKPKNPSLVIQICCLISFENRSRWISF